MVVEKNISLKSYNTFGIDVAAKYFASFSTVTEISELLEFKEPSHRALRATFNHILNAAEGQPSTLILGGGSNILFTKNFDGIVLKNGIKGIEIVGEDDGHVYVKAGAGENWHQLVLYCIANNLAGIENLSLIPGNVGASPMQNIGAYGVEIKDVFHSLNAYHLKDKTIAGFNLADCAFGYRESVFKKKLKNQFVITDVTFKLNKKPVFNTSYGAIEQELEKMRVKELTIKAWGSFFKNPEISSHEFQELIRMYPSIVGYDLTNGNVKLAAGWLIEQCGPKDAVSWKGYRKGDAGCHAKQALVLVNYGHAAGKEIFVLSETIIETVRQKFGVALEREVNII